MSDEGGVMRVSDIPASPSLGLPVSPFVPIALPLFLSLNSYLHSFLFPSAYSLLLSFFFPFSFYVFPFLTYSLSILLLPINPFFLFLPNLHSLSQTLLFVYLWYLHFPSISLSGFCLSLLLSLPPTQSCSASLT